MFIVLPSGRPNSWRYYRWYTPIRGDRNNYGNWSFLRDGATPGNGVVENWFELLESWFNVAEEPAAINTAEAKKELEKLQGEWTMVSREMGGQKTRDEVLKQFRLTITGDEWIVTYQGKENLRMKLKINPTKDPRTLDMTPKGENEEGVSLGIYKLEGDTLTLCRMMERGDVARPLEFKTTREGEVVVVWRRAMTQ